jgi:hypothetical protein
LPICVLATDSAGDQWKQIGNLLAWDALCIILAPCVLGHTECASAAGPGVVARSGAPRHRAVVLPVMFAFFPDGCLYNQSGLLLETRKLLKEIQRVQQRPYKAEASRMENLHQGDLDRISPAQRAHGVCIGPTCPTRVTKRTCP